MFAGCYFTPFTFTFYVYFKILKWLSMSSGVFLDCPENVMIFPPSCQAGDVLNCTADSKPEAQYKWIEHHNNDNEVLGPVSYTHLTLPTIYSV